MSSPLRFGLIGLGAISDTHAQALRTAANCEIVAVASRRAERASAFGEQWGVRAYGRYEDLLGDESIDAVIIATASGQHLEPALQAIAAGKQVLIEKPLEVNLERAGQILEAARAAGVTVGGIFQHRFSDAFQRTRQAVANGELGQLILGNAYIKWYRSPDYYRARPWRGTQRYDGGAALINQSIHTIDLLLTLFGPVRTVYGEVATTMHAIEGEDLGLAILQFENGARATIEGSTAIAPGYPERLEVHGRRGSIVLSGGQIQAWNLAGEDGPATPTSAGSGASDPLAIGSELHRRQFEDFARAVAQKTAPAVDGPESLRALHLIRAIYESSRRGERIALHEVKI